MSAIFQPGYQGNLNGFGAPTYYQGVLTSIPRWRYNANNKIDIVGMDDEGTIYHDQAELNELAMIDVMYQWWFADEYVPPNLNRRISEDPKDRYNNPVCTLPMQHRFEELIYLQTKYMECMRCGFNPDLDASKPRYSRAHREWINWANPKGNS